MQREAGVPIGADRDPGHSLISSLIQYHGAGYGGGSLDEALANVLRHARYYAAFSLGRGVTGNRSRALSRLRHLVDVPAILVMRLLDRREHLSTLSESDLLSALSLIESYVLRRAICGFQTRGYWQVFAS